MGRRFAAIVTVLALAAGGTVAAPIQDLGEEMQGGATTHSLAPGKGSFSQPSANMAPDKVMDFKLGNGFFRRLWVTAPSSTKAADGLGPLFNARACFNCHARDGRGRPPGVGEDAVSLFLRLSIPAETEEQKALIASLKAPVIPEPTYGGQLQNFAIPGHAAEGRMVVTYEEVPVELAGGETASLRRPTYGVAEAAYGPLHPATLLSPRLAPPMPGLGLLELIPEEAILAKADPDDRDGDGISGRARRVWSHEHGRPMLGRFGWKAGNPTVSQQSADAFAGDMGLSTALFPAGHGDCTAAQPACRAAPHGGDGQYEGLEVPPQVLELVAYYTRNLALPRRRDVTAPGVQRGKQLFAEAGCASCHTPRHVTGSDPAMPEQSNQAIYPYTDLLLHDMGEGLADNRPEGEASGREWKTPPLWGVGLTQTVSGHTLFLHDGRARSLLEAVLWHGGEAQAARDRVAAMPKADRDALLLFLNSL